MRSSSQGTFVDLDRKLTSGRTASSCSGRQVAASAPARLSKPSVPSWCPRRRACCRGTEGQGGRLASACVPGRGWSGSCLHLMACEDGTRVAPGGAPPEHDVRLDRGPNRPASGPPTGQGCHVHRPRRHRCSSWRRSRRAGRDHDQPTLGPARRTDRVCPKISRSRAGTLGRVRARPATQQGSCYRFLYLIKAPGCASLRRARFPALAAPALLPSARSALPPPTRPLCRPEGHETRTKPAASRRCLRRGR